MKKEEFEERYCRELGISLEEYKKWKVTLPCGCDYDMCEGWVAIPNDVVSIEDHMELYAPKIKEG